LARGVNDWDTTSRLTAKLYELAVPGLSPTPSEVVHDYLLGEQPNAALQFIQDWKKRDPADWRAWQEEVNCLLLMGERPQANLRRLEAILRFSDISTVGNKFLTLDSDMTFSRSPSDDLESIESNPELDLAMQIAGESIPPAYKGKLLQILLSSESTRDGVPYERTKIVEYIESLAAKDPADFLPPLLLGHLDRERAGGNWFRRARRIAPELSETNLGIFLQRKSENSSSASIVYAGYQRFQMQQNHAADGLAWAEQLSWPQIRRAVADTDKPSNSQLMLYFRKHPRITADPLEVSHETRDYLVRIASSHEALVPARLAQACLEVIASDGASNPRNTDLWLELLRGDRAGSIPRRYHDRRLLLPIQFGFTEFWPNSFANKALRDDYLNRSGVHWIMPGWNSDDHNIGLRQTALTQLIKNFAAPTTRQLLYDLQQCGIPDAAGLVKRTRSLFGDNSMHANESDDSPDSALAVVARQLEAKKVAGTEATDNTLRESHLALEKSNPDAALWLAMVLAKTDPAFATLVAAELEKRDQTGAPDPQVLEWYDPNPYYGQMFRPNETPLTPLDRIMERWLWKWYEADTSRIPSVVNKLGELYGWHWDEFIDSESLLLFLEREMTLFENETPLKIHRRRRYFDSPWRQFMTLPDTPAASLHLPRSIANMNDYTDIPSSGMNDWPEREMVLQRQAYMEKNFNRFQNPRLRLYAAQLLYRGHTSRGIADGFSLNDLKTAVAAGLEHDPNWATARMLAATIALHEKRWEEACRLLELALETNLSGEDRWMIDHTLVKLALERESAESWESSEPVDQAARRALRRILRYPLDRDNILPVAAQMTTLGCHDLVQRLFRVHRVSRWSRDNQVELRVNRSAPTSLSSTNQNSTETRLRLLVCRTYVGLSQLEPLSGFTGGLTVKQIWLNKAEIPQLLERLDPKSYESAPSAAIRGRIAFQLGDRQLAENCFQRAMQLEPYRSEWRSQWLELNGFPEPSALGEVLQQFPPAQSVALVDLIERWMNAPQISLRDRLDMTEQLLAHLETIHGDDINATLANAMTRSLGDPLWSIYRIEQENRRLLEQMTSEAIVPTETEQRIERIHSRVPQIRIGSNMPSSR
jgi:tetratricopeptide (TPR) repeat protein